MSIQQGNFGKLVKAYDAVRPTYPTRVINFITGNISSPSPLILDLGCGTGISTRQLVKKKGFVVGCDIDAKMLHAALGNKSKNVSYALGGAEKLPFSDNKFDAVTAFSAFHWFSTGKSLQEIRRVAKKNAKFFIVQPRFVSSFKADLGNILSDYLGKDLSPRWRKKSFEELLFEKNLKFETYRTTVTDKYTLEDYLLLIQSHSVWHEVPQNNRTEVLHILRKHYKTKLHNGLIHEKREITVLAVKL